MNAVPEKKEGAHFSSNLARMPAARRGKGLRAIPVAGTRMRSGSPHGPRGMIYQKECTAQ